LLNLPDTLSEERLRSFVVPAMNRKVGSRRTQARGRKHCNFLDSRVPMTRIRETKVEEDRISKNHMKRPQRIIEANDNRPRQEKRPKFPQNSGELLTAASRNQTTTSAPRFGMNGSEQGRENGTRHETTRTRSAAPGPFLRLRAGAFTRGGACKISGLRYLLPSPCREDLFGTRRSPPPQPVRKNMRRQTMGTRQERPHSYLQPTFCLAI
jgi:hypothetical protein